MNNAVNTMGNNTNSIAQTIFAEIENIVSYTKDNGIPVFNNLDLNEIDFDNLNAQNELEEVINLDELRDEFNYKFNKFELEELDLSNSGLKDDIKRSFDKMNLYLENLLNDENECQKLINLLNDGKSKDELENLLNDEKDQEKSQIYERRNWIFLQLLSERAIQEGKNFNQLLDFIDIEGNYIMQAIINQNTLDSFDTL